MRYGRGGGVRVRHMCTKTSPPDAKRAARSRARCVTILARLVRGARARAVERTAHRGPRSLPHPCLLQLSCFPSLYHPQRGQLVCSLLAAKCRRQPRRILLTLPRAAPWSLLRAYLVSERLSLHRRAQTPSMRSSMKWCAAPSHAFSTCTICTAACRARRGTNEANLCPQALEARRVQDKKEILYGFNFRTGEPMPAPGSYEWSALDGAARAAAKALPHSFKMLTSPCQAFPPQAFLIQCLSGHRLPACPSRPKPACLCGRGCTTSMRRAAPVVWRRSQRAGDSNLPDLPCRLRSPEQQRQQARSAATSPSKGDAHEWHTMRPSGGLPARRTKVVAWRTY